MCQCARTISKQQLDELLTLLGEMIQCAEELHSRFYQELPSDIDIEMSNSIQKAKKVLDTYAD